MSDGKTGPSGKTDLRRRAEDRLKATDSKAGPERLLQELQVHEIELEMQNEELKRSRNDTDLLMEDYLDIYDFAPIGYFTLNPDGVILQGNLTGASLLEVERSRLAGHKLQIHISNEFYPSFNAFFSKTFEGETIESCEVKLLGGKGSARFVQLEARLSEDRKKCRLAMIDITKRRHAEALLDDRTRQLENANKELDSFSYSVSHDLRAPLRAIDGFTKIISRKADKFDEDTRRQFGMIRDNAKRMNKLIDDILAFSRLGRQDMKLVRIDMDGLVKEIWEELHTSNPKKQVSLRTGSLPRGMGDRALIAQVLSNLISNAIKYSGTRDLALVEVGSRTDGNEVVYYVKDNGVGFDMEYYHKLFGVFQRLHTSEEFEGTGVGLAIVERIIQRHGGRVWAEAKVDEGATFYFTIPG